MVYPSCHEINFDVFSICSLKPMWKNKNCAHSYGKISRKLLFVCF